MIKITRWTLMTLLAALLAGCGSSSTDKAQELADAMDMDAQYTRVVEMTSASYIPKFRNVPHAKIKEVIREYVTQDDLKEVIVEAYASRFDADELDLIIKATENPANAMTLIMGSKDGRALGQKSLKVQNDLMAEIAEAFSDVEEEILEDLTNLNEEARG